MKLMLRRIRLHSFALLLSWMILLMNVEKVSPLVRAEQADENLPFPTDSFTRCVGGKPEWTVQVGNSEKCPCALYIKSSSADELYAVNKNDYEKESFNISSQKPLRLSDTRIAPRERIALVNQTGDHFLLAKSSENCISMKYIFTSRGDSSKCPVMPAPGMIPFVLDGASTVPNALRQAMVGIISYGPGIPIQLCSGTVISKRWILTAAHCVAEKSVEAIYVGGNTLDDGKLYYASGIIVHPNFSYPSAITAVKHDIALVQTDREMSDVHPLPLNRNINVPSPELTVHVAGYGVRTLTPLSEAFADSVEKLQIADALSMDTKTCAAAYHLSNKNKSFGIENDAHLCVGRNKKCQGGICGGSLIHYLQLISSSNIT